MSKIKPILSLIPTIYRKNYEDIGMFFWIEAQRSLLPTLSVKECIQRYFNFIQCEWDFDCAHMTYIRLKKEYATSKEDTRLTQ